MMALDQAVLVDDQWTRPDQRHLPHEHVEELRQLVERGTPQKAADPGDPWVALDLEQTAARLVAVGQGVLLSVGVDDHRAELVDIEDRISAADPTLSEEDRAGRVKPDRQGDDRHQRRQQNQNQPGRHQIEAALDPPGRSGEPVALHAEQGRPLDFVELVGRADRLEESRQDAHSDSQALKDADHVQQAKVGIAVARRDQSAIDAVLGEKGLEVVGGAQHREPVDAAIVAAEGIRPTSCVFVPSHRSSLPESHSPAAALPRITQRSSLTRTDAIRRAAVRPTSIEKNSIAQRTMAWSRPNVPSTIMSPARNTSSV